MNLRRICKKKGFRAYISACVDFIKHVNYMSIEIIKLNFLSKFPNLEQVVQHMYQSF